MIRMNTGAKDVNDDSRKLQVRSDQPKEKRERGHALWGQSDSCVFPKWPSAAAGRKVARQASSRPSTLNQVSQGVCLGWAFCILVFRKAPGKNFAKTVQIDQHRSTYCFFIKQSPQKSDANAVKGVDLVAIAAAHHGPPWPRLPSSLMFDYPTMKEVANRIVELSIENAWDESCRELRRHASPTQRCWASLSHTAQIP